jgi:hypothetical protein
MSNRNLLVAYLAQAKGHTQDQVLGYIMNVQHLVLLSSTPATAIAAIAAIAATDAAATAATFYYIRQLHS